LTNGTLPDDVRAAAERGETVLAIKLLREQTGLGLKEAKELIEAQTKQRAAPPADLPPSITDALRRGQKIEAIRLLREYTGLGLAEAKRMVESMDHDAAARHTASSIHPESRAWVWWVIALAIAACLAYLALQ
jgi:ribosomal protein L7/L12